MSEITQNTAALKNLETQLIKQNSLPQSFLRGFITALGATVGLSLFLAMLAIMLNFIAQALGLEGIFEPIVKSLDIKR